MLFRDITAEERQALAVWFEAAFGRTVKSDPIYFADWVERYEKGTLWHRADLANQRTFELLLEQGKLDALELGHLIHLTGNVKRLAALRAQINSMEATATGLEQFAAATRWLNQAVEQFARKAAEAHAELEQVRVEELLARFPTLATGPQEALRYWLERILVHQQEDVKEVAFVALTMEQQVGIAHRGTKGYTPANIPYTGEPGQLLETVEQLNQVALGHTLESHMAIVFSTMKG